MAFEMKFPKFAEYLIMKYLNQVIPAPERNQYQFIVHEIIKVIFRPRIQPPRPGELRIFPEQCSRHNVDFSLVKFVMALVIIDYPSSSYEIVYDLCYRIAMHFRHMRRWSNLSADFIKDINLKLTQHCSALNIP